MLQIPPDYPTLLAQVAIFVVLWLLLGRLWFRPALRLIRERRERSEGALEEARALQAEAERLRAEQGAALDEARAEARREMQEILRDADAEHRRLVEEARAEAQRLVEDMRGRIAEDVAAARRDLRDRADEIGRAVAERALGRAV